MAARPDDLAIGNCLLIADFIDDDVPYGDSPIAEQTRLLRQERLWHLVGVPLAVRGISLPFVAVTPLQRRPSISPLFNFSCEPQQEEVLSLDTRRVRLLRADENYVKAFIQTETGVAKR